VSLSNHPSTSSGQAVYFYPFMLSLTKHDKLSTNGKYKQTFI
jgi:hypothetical protein